MDYANREWCIACDEIVNMNLPEIDNVWGNG